MSARNPWSTWPKSVESGAPDFNARVAEVGAGYYQATAHGEVDWWDWQRHVQVQTFYGDTHVFEYPPNGEIRALNPDEVWL